MSHLWVTRWFGLLPETHNQHFQPWPAFESYKLTIRSRRSFKLGARAQKTPAMLLLPKRTVRTGVICSASDGVIGISRSVATVSLGGRGRQQGAPQRRPLE